MSSVSPSSNQIYLVTGGSGFLGRHLTALLLKNKIKVRILTRKKDKALEKLGIELVEGSLQDYQSLLKAAEGTAGIYHLAGHVSHTRDPREEAILYETNVLGTINVIKVASQTCQRVVYASSSGVVGCSSSLNKLAVDESDYCEEEVGSFPYYRTKIEAERQARTMAESLGVHLVILRPSMLLGPGDFEFRSTRLVRLFLEKKLPFILPGGISFLDVRDAAAAFVAAMETSGASTQIYLLTAANWSHSQFIQVLEKTSGVSGPSLVLPSYALKMYSKFVNMGLFSNDSSEANPVSLEMACKFWSVDASRAKSALLFRPRDPVLTVADTVRWILDQKALEPFRSKL